MVFGIVFANVFLLSNMQTIFQEVPGSCHDGTILKITMLMLIIDSVGEVNVAVVVELAARAKTQLTKKHKQEVFGVKHL